MLFSFIQEQLDDSVLGPDVFKDLSDSGFLGHPSPSLLQSYVDVTASYFVQLNEVLKYILDLGLRLDLQDYLLDLRGIARGLSHQSDSNLVHPQL